MNSNITDLKDNVLVNIKDCSIRLNKIFKTLNTYSLVGYNQQKANIYCMDEIMSICNVLEEIVVIADKNFSVVKKEE